MRAVFVPQSSIDPSSKMLEITGDNARHLIAVTRMQKGEEILVLNGKGSKIMARVEEIKGKKLTLSLKGHEKCHPKNNIDLAVAVTKKDSFETIIRLCVELGIGRLCPIYTQYSQRNFQNTERISRLMENAMIQSNNPFYLQIMPAQGLDEIGQSIDGYDHLFYFSSRSQSYKWTPTEKAERILILIGPEGGFSLEEEKKLQASSWKFIHLPTYILRSSTAVPVAVGHILGLH